MNTSIEHQKDILARISHAVQAFNSKGRHGPSDWIFEWLTILVFLCAGFGFMAYFIEPFLVSGKLLPAMGLIIADIIVAVMAYCLAKVLLKPLREKSVTWSEHIDKLMSTYEPLDLTAWAALKETCSDRGGAEPEKISEWINVEQAAVKAQAEIEEQKNRPFVTLPSFAGRSSDAAN